MRFLLFDNSDTRHTQKYSHTQSFVFIDSDDDLSNLNISNTDKDNVLKYIYEKRHSLAFLFWNDAEKVLYFGSDPFGFKSLLILLGSNGLSVASTVLDHKNPKFINELSPSGIYSLNFSYNEQTHKTNVRFKLCRPHTHLTRRLPSFKRLVSLSRFGKINFNAIAHQFSLLLKRSLQSIVLGDERETFEALHLKKIKLMYSGGLDSIVLALLLSEILPEGIAIDLVNVAFVSNKRWTLMDVPDRVSAINGLVELRQIEPRRQFNLVEINVGEEDVERIYDLIKAVISPKKSEMDINLSAALYLAINKEGTVCAEKYDYISSEVVRYGVVETDSEIFKKYCSISPELTKFLHGSYSNFINNSNSPSTPIRNNAPENYTEIRPCQELILNGLGPDELLGGYGRHRTVFLKNGNSALNEEINKELSLLWSRNLGQAHRICSYSNVIIRYPYLEERLLSYVNGLPLNILCDFELPIGVGDKLLLRICAFNLGLRRSCYLVKRAFQFGSRIAKTSIHAGNFPGRIIETL